MSPKNLNKPASMYDSETETDRKDRKIPRRERERDWKRLILDEDNDLSDCEG